MIDRRTMISGMGLASLAASPAFTGPLLAQAASRATKTAPTREERISAAAAASRYRLDFSAGTFSGPAWDLLLKHGQESQFFLLGEEHGTAENPKLAAQLFAALVPSGYSNVAIETSAPMAAELDRALLDEGGLAGLFADQGSNVAFFGMREEAEWLAAARQALPGSAPFLWGNDYEVTADRRLIALLKASKKPAGAQAAITALEESSNKSWAQYAETKNPRYIFSFAGDPSLVRAVRSAWPKADAASRWILDTLEETFEINRLWVAGQTWESNERRSSFLRNNFLKHWRAEKKSGRSPKIFMKYGASHVVRGRNSTETFDLGSLVPEIAAIEASKAFHLLVIPGLGASTAALDPTSFLYRPGPPKNDYAAGLEPIVSQAWPDAFTLFDTHALRPLFRHSRTATNADLMRMVHGFDAILLMSGSTASSNL